MAYTASRQAFKCRTLGGRQYQRKDPAMKKNLVHSFKPNTAAAVIAHAAWQHSRGRRCPTGARPTPGGRWPTRRRRCGARGTPTGASRCSGRGGWCRLSRCATAQHRHLVVARAAARCFFLVIISSLHVQCHYHPRTNLAKMTTNIGSCSV